MSGAAAGVLAAILVAGLLCVAYGLAGGGERASTDDKRLSTSLWKERWTRGGPRALIALGAGFAAWLLTGWLVLAAVIPGLVLGLPYLLGTPRNRDLELLEALDRWVRALAATVPTGRSVSDALRVSRRQAPELLAEPVALLVRRLEERWTVREALFAFADELGSPDVDAVVAALVLAAERGGTGVGATLTALADSVSDRLRALREIETERAKPRTVVRQVTVITLVVLGAALLVGRGFFAPYGSPLGQLILGGLIAVYVGSLLLLRRLSTERRRSRILAVRP